METRDQIRRLRGFRGVPKLMLSAVVGALAGSCAVAGAFLGAVAGALGGRASDCGVLRGAALGAVAGAVLSFEMFEASRACWCLEQTGSRGPSAMADFIEQLLRGRLIDEQFSPTMLTAHHWQVSIAAGSYHEMNDIQDGLISRGLSGDLLHSLPHHEITKEIKALHNIFCAICLQDIEIGETARNLPRCQHMFHLTCVDMWLIRHGSCPICRQYV